ncbi:MAG TPA: hypothetical protein PLI19_00590 [Erysipelotrichaceae bacterium]|nr:hypothetical protein [Erysipelotrichaceae bacterium]HQB31802.1 hypothetical protein [Erysipelotrichaceae bacterium]
MKNELRGIGILLFALVLNTSLSPMLFFAIPVGLVGLVVLFKKESQ